MKRSNILERVAPEALKKWGLTAQLDMLLEECGELTQAVCKLKRGKIEYTENLAEEIADVYIMLYQIEQAYNIEKRVNEIELMKLEKLDYIVSKADY